MRRYRLRYQATDLEMPKGDFVIGRSSSCNLALGDALVSRRHAILHVADERVMLEDLGSRNGVHVNGERIEGTRDLRHLDRVMIGSQEMVLIEVVEGQRERRTTSEQPACDVCRAPLAPRTRRCPQCGSPVASSRRTLAGATVEVNPPTRQPTDEPTQIASAFQLVSHLADKALALGRVDEAERMLSHHLEGMLRRARGGHDLSQEEIFAATRFVMRLAELRPLWIDWIFDIYAASGRLIPAPTIDRLHDVVRKVRYSDLRALRAYLAVLRTRTSTLSPNERFLMKRIEGLERVIAA